jgi:hypothetical protein
MRYIDSEISDLLSNVAESSEVESLSAEVQRYQIKLAGYNTEVKKYQALVETIAIQVGKLSAPHTGSTEKSSSPPRPKATQTRIAICYSILMSQIHSEHSYIQFPIQMVMIFKEQIKVPGLRDNGLSQPYYTMQHIEGYDLVCYKDKIYIPKP